MKHLTRRAFGGATLASMASLATLTACESTPVEITDRSMRPIPVGFVANRDITITAADGSFELKGGQQFSTPFQSDIWSRNFPNLGDDRIVEGFAGVRAGGARDVRVRVAGRPEALYGVLVLSPVFGSAEGPGARSYQISVPQDKIEAAYAGRTAVAYENVRYIRRWDTGARRDAQWRSWILWLSMTPL